MVKILLSKFGSLLVLVDDSIINQELSNLAYKSYPRIFCEIPTEFKTYEMCIDALKHNGNNIKYIPDNQITDELLKIAIKEDVDSLRFIPKSMQTDELLDFAKNYNKKHGS